MEHSQAIMADAGKTIDEVAHAREQNEANSTADVPDSDQLSDGQGTSRKRKGDFQESRGQRGSRRGGRNDNRRHPRGDMGRTEYFRDNPDKRQKTSDAREKRQRDGTSYGKEFTKEEIESEEKRPKRKVAVFIGYSGTGYKGMQITPSEKTIEGDLFKAFIDAGAISKANADDPKKASLVRCARTDKGVHAAGNMVSLKLIIEDEDIVEKINSHLSPQIRVWGLERTTGSFSCYQAVDSRWYEYLIPSYSFLPPHPSSWLAKKLEQYAEEAGDMEKYRARQHDVQDFWEKVEAESIRPLLQQIDEDIRYDVIKALQGEDEANAKAGKAEPGIETSAGPNEDSGVAHGSGVEASSDEQRTNGTSDRSTRLRAAAKLLRNAYVRAKRRYRIPATRIERLRDALSKYVGTTNFHNYTIQKTYKDPSAKRHIKSFVVNPKPILIGDGPDEEKSEWLSLKVHGQSFMMHQIRKMVGMATLLIRCGSSLTTLDESFNEGKFSIPKVPGLGLLLERPVFDSYNANQAAKHERAPLLFSKYDDAIEDFKQREIYQRIFREEEERNEFHKFFNHIDNFKESYFLFVTSKGLEATKGAGQRTAALPEVDGESGDEMGEE